MADEINWEESPDKAHVIDWEESPDKTKPQETTEIDYDNIVFMNTGLSVDDYRRMQTTDASQLSAWGLIERGYNASVFGVVNEAGKEKPNPLLISPTAEEVAKTPVEERALTSEEFNKLPWWKRQLMGGTTLLLDFPVMAAGFAIGTAGGAVTGPGALITGTAGAFALPAGLRKVYTDRVRNGSVDSFSEFWDRLSGGVIETAKGWDVGALTGAVGGAVAPAVTPYTGKFVGGIAKLAAEGTTMVTVGAMLDGRVPEPQEFLDAAIMLGAMHASIKLGTRIVVGKDTVKLNEKSARIVRDKLLKIYEETGITPKDVIEVAAKDSKFKEQLFTDTTELPTAIIEKIKEKESVNIKKESEERIKTISTEIEQIDKRMEDLDKKLEREAIEGETLEDRFGYLLALQNESRNLKKAQAAYNFELGKTSKLEASSRDIETSLLDIENEISRSESRRSELDSDKEIIGELPDSLIPGEMEKLQRSIDIEEVRILELNKQADYLRGQRERLGAIEESERTDYGSRLDKLSKEQILDVLEPTESVREVLDKYSKPEPSNLWTWTKEHLSRISHLISREFEHLPRNEYGDLKFKLRLWQKSSEITNDRVSGILKNITKDLDKDSYKLFNYKIVLEDMVESYRKQSKIGSSGEETLPKLPGGLSIQEVNKELSKINEEITKSSHRENIEKGLQLRKETWLKLKEDYVDALKEIGLDVGEKLTLDEYFRHIIIEYTKDFSNVMSKQLKTPAGKSYLKARSGSEKPYYTDFLYVENSVITSIMNDINTANLIKFLKEEYSKPRKAELEKLASESGKEGTTWRDYIDIEKEELWQPRKGNAFYIANSMVDRNLGELLKKMLDIDDTTLSKMMESKEVKDVVGGFNDPNTVAVGKMREEYVLPKEIVATLDKIATPENKSPVTKVISGATGIWKRWVLGGPVFVVKYLTRNLTGDIDVVIAGNPGALFTPEGISKLYTSTKDISQYYISGGKDSSPSLREWLDRGGSSSTLQAQEKIVDLNALKDALSKFEVTGIVEKATLGAWKAYWKGIRMINDARESVLRYENYLIYKESIESDLAQGGKGVPHNWGASSPKDIMQITDPKDRAFALSNDLLGAYDRISEMGQGLRSYVYPFWSFKEINFKRYWNLLKNAVHVPEFNDSAVKSFQNSLGSKIGKFASLTPLAALRLGTLLLKVNALTMGASIYNHWRYPEEEKKLSEDVRKRPHVILYKDDEGEPAYFTRIGSLGDLLDWVGFANAPDLATKLIRGEITKDEFAEEYAGKYLPTGKIDLEWTNAVEKTLSSVSKTIYDGSMPLFKQAYDVYNKTESYPELRGSKETSRIGIAAKNLGVYNFYKKVANLVIEDKYPIKEVPWGEWALKQVAYKSNTYESAYFDILAKKDKFLSNLGKTGFNNRMDPKTQFLYNAKVSMRVGDKVLMDHYIKKYFENGGTQKGFKKSLESLSPLTGLSDIELAGFLNTLNKDEIVKFDMALVYYGTLLGGPSKQQEK